MKRNCLMIDAEGTRLEHIEKGSNKSLTLIALAFLAVVVFVWSVISPLIGLFTVAGWLG